MIGYLRAVAADFDGTLTANGRRPRQKVLDALQGARDQGVLTILVTGRIMSELRTVFADVEQHFDVIVAENGAVLWTPGHQRRLATPVDPFLVSALADRGVVVRQGEVVLAGMARDRAVVLDEAHRLELDCQLVFNRMEMMIVPAGITKGTGLFEALGDIGVSRHSTLGVGDAENDHALLDVCEVGVAVADAVISLRSFADVVLREPNGAGVLQLLKDLTDDNFGPVHSLRWRIRLGVTDARAPVSLPGSQINVLITGKSGSGKSHLAGLFAERMISQGYCVLVIDPEGDHTGLGRMRGVAVMDARDGLPPPHRVVEVFSQRFTSVVLDLSQVREPSRSEYLENLLTAVQQSRISTGLPHWIVADEADQTVGSTETGSMLLKRATVSSKHWGLCLVTWRPDLMDARLLGEVDAMVTTSPPDTDSRELVDLLASTAGLPPEIVDQQLAQLVPGKAFLAMRAELGRSATFRVAERVTDHRRHWHKYTHAKLTAERWFYFRNSADVQVATAANLRELQDVLQRCESDVVEHHCHGNDLSRWLAKTFADHALAADFATIESKLAFGQITTDQARALMISSVRSDYGVGPPTS